MAWCCRSAANGESGPQLAHVPLHLTSGIVLILAICDLRKHTYPQVDQVWSGRSNAASILIALAPPPLPPPPHTPSRPHHDPELRIDILVWNKSNTCM